MTNEIVERVVGLWHLQAQRGVDVLLRRGRDLPLISLGRPSTTTQPTTTLEISLIVVSTPTLAGADTSDEEGHKMVCFVHWSNPVEKLGRIVEVRDGRALAPAFSAVRDFRAAEVALAARACSLFRTVFSALHCLVLLLSHCLTSLPCQPCAIVASRTGK